MYMKINGFTFEHLTKEDLGVNVEEVVNTNLYKLIRSCIENENTLFYNKNDKSYGICDLNTFEKYIKADYIICYNIKRISTRDIFDIFDKYILSPEMKKGKEERDKYSMFNFLEKEESEFDKKYRKMFNEFREVTKTIYAARVTEIIK